ncbi:hypothetical protein AVEN_81729-1 [Araneus ventricosus]|uniref:Uncharacterized protein n=1 Tax=Araneus ventricosus TaxID=182803 RepID=A0A4Y2D134_ARAVE|nr:hypothetical protein AVEN_81729-1 [Araneus ventricosus]
MNLYLILLERQPEQKANDYIHIKGLLSKRFKFTPGKYRQLFSAHQKSYNNTWADYYHELSTYFDGWTLGLKVQTCGGDLRKLIISDQMKQRTPTDFKEHFLDEWTTIDSPVDLAEKFEGYEDMKKTLKQKSRGSYFKGRQYFKGTEKFRKLGLQRKFEYNRTDMKFPASRCN